MSGRWVVRALGVSVGIGLLSTLVVPARANEAPRDALRPATAAATVSLPDPIAQAQQALGGPQDPLDFEGCEWLIDTNCPINRPPSAYLRPLPDADGDGREDVLSVSQSWSQGRAQHLVVLETWEEPVLRTVAAAHNGLTGALLWQWRAVDGEGTSFLPSRGDMPRSLFALNDATVTALDTATGAPRWATSLASTPILQTAGFRPAADMLGFADMAPDPGLELVVSISETIGRRVLALRVSDGAILANRAAPGYFRFAGDLDGDGGEDLVTIEYPSQQPPLVRAIRGVDGTTLWQRSVTGPRELGFGLYPLGDLDRDGRDDLAIGSGYYLSDEVDQPPNLRLLRSDTGEDRFAVHSAFGPVAVDGDGDGDLDIAAQRFAFASNTAESIEARYLTFDVGGNLVSKQTYSAGGPGAYWFGLERATYSALDIDGDGSSDFGHHLRAWDRDENLLAEDSALTHASGTAFSRPAPYPLYGLAFMPSLDGAGHDKLRRTVADGKVAYQVLDGVTGDNVVSASVPLPQSGYGGWGYASTADVDGDGRGDLLLTVTTDEQAEEHDHSGYWWTHSTNQVHDGRTGEFLWAMTPIVPAD